MNPVSSRSTHLKYQLAAGGGVKPSSELPPLFELPVSGSELEP